MINIKLTNLKKKLQELVIVQIYKKQFLVVFFFIFDKEVKD